MRKVFALLLVASLILCMTGCGATSSDTANANVDELQQRIDELEAENAELREQLAEFDAVGSVSTDITAPEDSAQPDAQSAEIGTAYTITDLCEFAVVYADLKKEVLPPNPDSYYTYYPEKDGMTYLDVAVSVKTSALLRERLTSLLLPKPYAVPDMSTLVFQLSRKVEAEISLIPTSLM